MTSNVAILHHDDKDLRAVVKDVLTQDALSLNSISQLTGIGKTRLSQWLANKYPGDNETIESDIRLWLESRQVSVELESNLPAAPEWVETVSAREVLGALSYAQMAEQVTVVYGGAGVGKTTSIRRYRKQAPNVWVVTATPACSSAGALLKRIAQAMNLRISGNVDVYETSIIERARDSRGLLIIDEAQHLTYRALEAARSIHDAAAIGLALVGNEIVYSQLTGGSRTVGFAQLFSRLAKRVRLAKARDADVLAMLDAWGIEDKDARLFCLSIGRRPGALRGLTQTLRLASMFAANESTTVEHLRDAWADLGGEAA